MEHRVLLLFPVRTLFLKRLIAVIRAGVVVQQDAWINQNGMFTVSYDVLIRATYSTKDIDQAEQHPSALVVPLDCLLVLAWCMFYTLNPSIGRAINGRQDFERRCSTMLVAPFQEASITDFHPNIAGFVDQAFS